MKHKLIGPFEYKKFENDGILGKILDTSETVKELEKYVIRAANIGDMELYLKYYEPMLHGLYLTSTKTKGIPKEGLFINGKKIPFGNYHNFPTKITKETYSQNKIIENLFSEESFFNLFNMANEGELNFSVETKGFDVGFHWESFAIFDIDYEGDYFGISIDDSLNSKEKYIAFI